MDPDTMGKGFSNPREALTRQFLGSLQSDRGSRQTVIEACVAMESCIDRVMNAVNADNANYLGHASNVATVSQETPIMSFGSDNYLGLGQASYVAKRGGLPIQQAKHAISNCSHPIVYQRRTSDPEAFGKAFAGYYYSTFDGNRANLVRLYQETSIMTLDGHTCHGLASIAQKLKEIPIEQCKHDISTVDCQPSSPAGDMLVCVSGLLHYRFAGEEYHHRFSQTFILTPTPEGSFVIQNDILQLNDG